MHFTSIKLNTAVKVGLRVVTTTTSGGCWKYGMFYKVCDFQRRVIRQHPVMKVIYHRRQMMTAKRVLLQYHKMMTLRVTP